MATVPESRIDFPDPWNTSLVPCALALGDLPPFDAVQVVAPQHPSEAEIQDFANLLRREVELTGYVEVVGIDARCRYLATSVIARALGGLTGEPRGPLGGEITEVVTSNAFDHNLAWHTDSTSWERPNRWQTLTLIAPDRFGRRAPTSILPWSVVLQGTGAGTLRSLRTTSYAWREQFPDLPPLHAPVLGSFPRWLRPALAEQLGGDGRFCSGALEELNQAIVEAEGFVEVDVTETSVVVFDNQAVLHRGPHLDPDGGRTVIRLKLGGIVGDLEVDKSE